MIDPLDLLFAEPEDELGQLLADLRWLVLRHPVATRSAARALIAEGRRFAETEEGQRWKERLGGSELVRRAQLVLDVGTWGSLAAGDEHLLPSQLVDALARAASRRDLEAELARRVEIDAPETP